jgi:MFS family permease
VVEEGVREVSRPEREELYSAEHGRIRDAIRDYWKVRYDLAKQIGAASGVLLVALVALLGVFYPYPRYPVIALVSAGSLVISAIGALLGMMLAIKVIAELVDEDETTLETLRGEEPTCPQESDTVAKANTRFRRFRWVPVIALIVGVVGLLCFAAFNLRLWPAG